MLEVKNLRKRFGGIAASNGVSLDVRQGEVHALIGPTAGMGPEESQRMIALVDRLCIRLTVLLVEHDMDAVFRLADRISVLVNGQVIATGNPSEIRKNPDVIRAYLGEEAAA